MNLLAGRDRTVSEQFLHSGYVIAPAEDRVALDRIRDAIVDLACAHLGLQKPADPQPFLDGIAQHVDPSDLNALRLHVINGLQAEPWIREAYFATARTLLETIVGNELAMQRGLTLSVQLPEDGDSLLPLHSDVWSEDSPFECVLWIPFVDCYRTKSMFLLPPEANARWLNRMIEFGVSGTNALYEAVKDELDWLEISYGQVLLFTHTIMHGNTVNREPTTRWSMNVRFKGLFTPYADKRLGEYFEPISIRPASRIGMTFRMPQGFRD